MQLGEAVLTQTSPSYTPVCPNDKLVLTCVTNGTVASTFWRHSSSSTSGRLTNAIRSTTTGSGGLLALSVTDIVNNTLTSTGTIQSLDASLNGTMIGCSPTLLNESFVTFTIKMTGNSYFIILS